MHTRTDAAAMAHEANVLLKQFCRDRADRCTFVEFPIESWRAGDDRWVSDGLHFSQKGYEYLGTQLAPAVTSALSLL